MAPVNLYLFIVVIHCSGAPLMMLVSVGSTLSTLLASQKTWSSGGVDCHERLAQALADDCGVDCRAAQSSRCFRDSGLERGPSSHYC